MKELYNITKDGATARIEEATPNDSHKSFYGKAKIYHLTNGGRILESYATPVIYEAPTGELWNLWGGWSATTGRHIRAFCGKNKAEVEALPKAHAVYFHNGTGDLITERIEAEE